MLNENFEEFVAHWRHFKDRLVIFLGAGASIGAVNADGHPLMNAYELRNELWKSLKVGNEQAQFDPADLKLMTLEHAAAIIEASVGRTIISERLVRIFSCNRPLWQHSVLPFLRPCSLFTTNYDELIELGYRADQDGMPIDVICDNRAPYDGRVALFKPHGSLTHANQPVGRGGLVVTQFDYFEMIGAYRKMLSQSILGFNGKCVLLIGYSFGDMDIGAELYDLRRKNADVPWYAIFPRNDPQVRKMYSKRMGIEQIDMTFETFLTELDQRVNFIPDRLKHDKILALRTQGIIQ